MYARALACGCVCACAHVHFSACALRHHHYHHHHHYYYYYCYYYYVLGLCAYADFVICSEAIESAHKWRTGLNYQCCCIFIVTVVKYY